MLRQAVNLTRTMVTMCTKVPTRNSSIINGGGMHVTRNNNEQCMCTRAFKKMDVRRNGEGGLSEDTLPTDFHNSSTYGTSNLYTDSSADTLSFDFEEVASSQQPDIIDELLEEMLKKTVYQFVNLNHVTETVYRYKLHMLMRKMGYRGWFTRYNGETGMARFVNTLKS